MFALEVSRAAVSEANIRAKQCFACGRTPTTGAGEHVIPKWLQSKLGLFDERLTLLNGTQIPYRSLTVPCCAECNNGFLSAIEREVHPIFTRGTLIAGDELVLGRWLSKILIGILVKETSLSFDRTKPSRGSIVEPEFLDELQHCHFIMQSGRKPTLFRCLHGGYPFSLYHYQIADSDADTFDLSTNVYGQSISIRIGALGVVFVNDGGLQLHIGAKGPFGLSGATVTPVQFAELSARIHFKAALRDATHFYLTFENDQVVQIEQLHVKSFSGYIPGTDELQIFRGWDEEQFSYALAAYTRIPRSELFDEAARVCRTSLGNFILNATDERLP
ncbi:hypothetical protein GR212_32625 [Rhizobium lusitanum]|uniref:HNH endonuclease n=1 Tax=Rhizobium lusitanum TaxID=293958 RepID=A0A6L9UIU1_9HYPH|nr:hypothetical protein [Rhizobium lusitanum]NEI74302.1 hypothetical protein [Rhizobium lusitanum]